MISDNKNFAKFNPGSAWHEYPPKKTLLPSDDFTEVSAFGVSGVLEAKKGWVKDEVKNVEAMELTGEKNIKKKNKTRKDKRKKYKKKKKRKN